MNAVAARLQIVVGLVLFAILILLLRQRAWFDPWFVEAPATARIDVSQTAPQLLGRNLRVIADPQRHWQADEILAGRHDADTLQLRQVPPNLGYPRERYWVVLELHNPSLQAVDTDLVLWRGSAHRQRSYTLRLDAGPAAARPLSPLRSRHTVLPLHLQPGEVLRIANWIETDTALVLDYRLLRAADLARMETVDYAAFGVLCGATTAIALYVFALFFALRERLYLWFAGFAFGSLVYYLHTEAYAYLLWPESLRPLGNAVSTSAGVLFSLSNALFVRDYLQLPQTQPRLDRRLLKPLMLALLLVFPLFPLAPWLANRLAAAGVTFGVFLLAAAVIRAALREPPVWSFQFGMMAFFVSGIAHLLKRAGVLPDSQAITLTMQAATILNLVAFSVALMARVRRMVETHQAAQREYAERLRADVAARTAELSQAKEHAEQALDKLQGAQKQLVAAEKMASLGQLVAGVAHEINTPIGIAVTAASHLRDVSRGFAGKADEGKLTRSDLASWRSAVDEAARLILGSLQRAHGLIGSFKQVAVDQSSEQRRRFDLATFLGEVQFALQPSYKRTGHQLEIDCPPGIELDTYPGALFQIFTNLVNNSMLHGFDEGQAGLMRIAARADADQVYLLYSDDGRGMNEEVVQRAFDPFFTTRRGSGGSGLGLHLVYNLATQLLGGSIELHSSPGQGTEFELCLPRAPRLPAEPQNTALAEPP